MQLAARCVRGDRHDRLCGQEGLSGGDGSSAIVLRRDTGGMWAGAGVPRGSCDTYQVLCDARERALPSWLAFN
jgi:hypothetical protein